MTETPRLHFWYIDRGLVALEKQYDSWDAFFKAHDFFVGPSVDGLPELHNAYRMDKGGAGSFDRVMGGWEALRQNRAPSETVRWYAMEDARLARAVAEAGSIDPCPCGSGRTVKRSHSRRGKRQYLRPQDTPRRSPE